MLAIPKRLMINDFLDVFHLCFFFFFDIPVDLNYLYPIYSRYFRNSHERRPF